MGKLFFVLSVFLFAGCSYDGYKETECTGNIESFEKKVLRYGIDYKVSYLINGDFAKIRIAGREIDTKATKGKSFLGYWLLINEPNSYLSYLPSDGGTIKFKLENGEWFSGTCHDKSPN